MTPNKVQEVAESAFWRQPHNRKTHWQALAALPFRTPLLGAPFFTLDILQLDWLHIVDLGVAQVFFGKCLQSPVRKVPWQFRTAMQSLAWENEILVFSASDPVQAGPTVHGICRTLHVNTSANG